MRGLEAVEEAQNALVLRFGVDPDHGEVGGDLVAQHALDDVEIVIDQRGRLRAFGAILDVLPQAFQEADVGAEFLFAGALRGGADDEASVAVLALAEDDALQALALFFGRNLARHAGVIHRRHVDQEAAGQRDVAGDARAFLADGLLGDLDQNFLAFFEQVADQRNGRDSRGGGNAAATASTSPPAVAAAALVAGAIMAGTRTLGALRVSGGCRRSANFDAGIDGAVAAGFGVEHGFRFGLSLFEFEFFAVLFAFGGSCLRRDAPPDSDVQSAAM